MQKYIFPRVESLTPEQMRKALDDIAALLWVENCRDYFRVEDGEQPFDAYWLSCDKEVNGVDFIDSVIGVLREVEITAPTEEKYIGHELP